MLASGMTGVLAHMIAQGGDFFILSSVRSSAGWMDFLSAATSAPTPWGFAHAVGVSPVLAAAV